VRVRLDRRFSLPPQAGGDPAEGTVWHVLPALHSPQWVDVIVANRLAYLFNRNPGFTVIKFKRKHHQFEVGREGR